MVRLQVRRDHPKTDILHTRPLDLPRRPDPQRIRVQQQRHHHRRVIRRPTLTVRSIRPIKHVKVHLLDRAEHRPNKMILRQPIHQRRRQQERLTAITRHEVLTHPGIVLDRPDGTLNPTATA
jgi:hypothetical protein